MKLKYEFMLNPVGDKIVAMPVGEDMEKFGGFIKLDSVGGYIFKMLGEDVTKDDIVIAMAHDFPEETEEEIKKVVTNFINQLKKDDLII